jgi:hypothetical protein
MSGGRRKICWIFFKKCWSTFCLKNVASIFLSKNVITFVGKMLLQHFLKHVDENVGNNPEKYCRKIVGNNPKKC